MPDPKKMQYGWYSLKQHQMMDEHPHGTSSAVYQALNGQEVIVTMVTDSPDHQTKWDDMACLGLVVKYLRPGPEAPLQWKPIMPSPEIISCLLIGLGHLKHSMHAAPSREAENFMLNDFNRINACLESLGAKPQEPPKRQFQEKLGSSSPAR